MLLQTKIYDGVKAIYFASMESVQSPSILCMLSEFSFHGTVWLRYNFKNMSWYWYRRYVFDLFQNRIKLKLKKIVESTQNKIEANVRPHFFQHSLRLNMISSIRPNERGQQHRRWAFHRFWFAVITAEVVEHSISSVWCDQCHTPTFLW